MRTFKPPAVMRRWEPRGSTDKPTGSELGHSLQVHLSLPSTKCSHSQEGEKGGSGGLLVVQYSGSFDTFEHCLRSSQTGLITSASGGTVRRLCWCLSCPAPRSDCNVPTTLYNEGQPDAKSILPCCVGSERIVRNQNVSYRNASYRIISYHRIGLPASTYPIRMTVACRYCTPTINQNKTQGQERNGEPSERRRPELSTGIQHVPAFARELRKCEASP